MLIEVIDSVGVPKRVCWNHKRRFQFEACWVDDTECCNLITANWGHQGEQSNMQDVLKGIHKCALSLDRWNQGQRRSLRKVIVEKKKELSDVSRGLGERHFGILGGNVKAACLQCLNDGEPMDMINMTLVTLIPKVSRAKCMIDFLPISLCNVSYKIIAKTLANWLRLVLDVVISKNQSAFVPVRLIYDNVVIAVECIHGLRTRKRKAESIALKLDMSKAYDRVEWGFCLQ
ncbi:hypothetical protein Ddye_015826 [Dipteronia dyeriana]|uniref:Reverse transcriptase domain-containing protein n=1 Tax=Dipteronia dyeriana TaxID=168575 RepID=A0AAD9U5Q0_9ROSI|nr:hypothetical protein Ddye_015826 [Dipteronia dyeriana]